LGARPGRAAVAAARWATNASLSSSEQRLRKDRSTQAMTRISFILPVLNEAALIEAQLQRLQTYRECGHEVVVVDGGSTDGTPALALKLADTVLSAAPGRSLQMNAGAAVASGDLLVFLHVDAQLPEAADRLLLAALAVPGSQWGWFSVHLSNPALPFRIIAACMNLRTQLSFVCTGDQALFVSKQLFTQIGGFPPLPLMEDVAICKRLRRKSTPHWITRPVLASSRRWEQQGLVRTVVLMWWLRLLYFCGVSPTRLQQMYYPAAVKPLTKSASS